VPLGLCHVLYLSVLFGLIIADLGPRNDTCSVMVTTQPPDHEKSKWSGKMIESNTQYFGRLSVSTKIWISMWWGVTAPKLIRFLTRKYFKEEEHLGDWQRVRESREISEVLRATFLSLHPTSLPKKKKKKKLKKKKKPIFCYNTKPPPKKKKKKNNLM